MKPEAAGVIFAGLFAFFLILTLTAMAAGESTFQVQSMILTVYRDGLVHAEQGLIVDETAPEITLSLLSDSTENVLLLDENKTSMDYKIEGKYLTAYTLGARNVLLEYDTISLTRKDAEVWTLVVDHEYNLTVSLPQNSTVIFLSKMPTAIETKGSIITLALSPGQWEISYVLPVSVPDKPADQSDNTDSYFHQFPLAYLAIAVVAAAAVLLTALILYRRKRGPNVEKILKAHPQLAREDQAVIQFLAEKEGKAFEAELREKFPDTPRTSLWRLVRRLERLEIVEVKKVGLENQVELKK
jgi:uncharacterized membrane protein